MTKSQTQSCRAPYSGLCRSGVANPSDPPLSVACQWDKGRIVEMGWSAKLDLCVVEEDGTCHAYDVHGTFVRSFSLGKVMDCRGYDVNKVLR